MSELQAQCWICPHCHDDKHHKPGGQWCLENLRRDRERLEGQVNGLSNWNIEANADNFRLRESLQELVAAMREYQMDVCGEADAPGEHRLMMERAEALLSAEQPRPDWKPGQQEGLLKLAEFGRQIFNGFSDGGAPDPWDMQEMAEDIGLMEPEQRNEPCSDGDPDQCRCLEYEADFPATCYRVPDKYMPLLREQLTRPEPPEVE